MKKTKTFKAIESSIRVLAFAAGLTATASFASGLSLDTTNGPQTFGVMGQQVGTWTSSGLSVNGTVTSGNELISSAIAGWSNVRMIGGGYGAMLRNDGSNFYVLMTNQNDTLGGWNSLRPLTINDTTGLTSFNNSVSINTGTSDTPLTVGAVTPGMPTGWGGGIHSFDVYANGTLAAGVAGSTPSYLNSSGYGYVANDFTSGNSIHALAYYHSSDARLKTDIHPIKGALDKLLTIRGVEFNWKKDGRPDMGVVAQNVREVFPNVVTTDSNGKLAVEYDSLAGPMIEAIRELKHENDTLRDQVAALEELKTQMKDIHASLRAMKEENAHLRSIKGEKIEAITHPTSLAP